MSNFIIFFSGREGSSPIITQLASHPDIRVPIFEHFDRATAKQSWPDTHPADLIDYAFRTGHKPSQDETPPTSEQSVGFKWRAWGQIDKLHPVIAHHKPVLFHLFRRNLLDYAASRYMSDHIVPELPEAKEMGFTGFGHSQFKFKDLSGDQQQRLREAMNKVHFSIPVDFATDRIQKVVDAKAQVEKNYLIRLENNGAKVHHICYEDYLSDPKVFLEDFANQYQLMLGLI